MPQVAPPRPRGVPEIVAGPAGSALDNADSQPLGPLTVTGSEPLVNVPHATPTPGPSWRTGAVMAGILVVTVVTGRIAGAHLLPLLHDRMLPWILGRSLGLASYLALTGMILTGLWLRHPWRGRFRRPAASTILWSHVALAACTLTLLAGHLTALALDRYAGVGWIGVAVPWASHYRPTPVALGVLALYGVVLVAGTAALAGSIGRRIWFPVHSVAVSVFCATAAHGILAGSDASGLRWLYVATCLMVIVLQGTRWVAGTLQRNGGVHV